MTLCIVDGGHCNCQPDEGVVCDKLPKKIRDYVLTAVSAAVEAEQEKTAAEIESFKRIIEAAAGDIRRRDERIAELEEKLMVMCVAQLKQSGPAPDPPAPVQDNAGR